MQGYDGHTTLKGDVKHALLQRSRWPTGSVRGDERRVPILEVRHQLVRRPASVVPRRSEDEPLHTEHAQKHGNRLRVPGREAASTRAADAEDRPEDAESIPEKTTGQTRATAEDVVRLGRDVSAYPSPERLRSDAAAAGTRTRATPTHTRRREKDLGIRAGRYLCDID